MRKMKKINGYLVVRFNDREKRGYPELGNFGVLDAELYSGNLAVDLGAMEYTDAGTLEEAMEQTRGLDSEFDMEEPEVQLTIVKDVGGVTSEELYDPVKMFSITRALLAGDIQRGMGEDIDPRTAAHELRGFAKALTTMGVVQGDDERFYVALDSFDPPGPDIRLTAAEGHLAYICDEVCKHRAADISQEELDTFCGKCKVGRWSGDPPKTVKLTMNVDPAKVKNPQNLLGLLEEIQDYTNGKSETPSPARPCCGFWDNGYQSIQLLNGDGSAELSPHNFVEQEVIEGCTVQVLRCRECGYESFAWFKPGKEVRT